MRYFFNLADEQQFIVDSEGVEVADLSGLRTQVTTAIRELRREDASAARDWRGWRLEVTDTSGDLLLTINLDQFQRETFAGLPFSSLLFLQCDELHEHIANMIPHGVRILN
jgi:hypothetical protein